MYFDIWNIHIYLYQFVSDPVDDDNVNGWWWYGWIYSAEVPNKLLKSSANLHSETGWRKKKLIDFNWDPIWTIWFIMWSNLGVFGGKLILLFFPGNYY